MTNSHSVLDYQFISKLKMLSFVQEIWLFGSRARGDNQDRSDIDLAILCQEASDEEWLTLMEIINEADTLLKVDCVRFEKGRISDELYNNILKDKKVIYVKD